MNLEKLRDVEYIKCVDLLTELLDLDADAKEKSISAFKRWELKVFFCALNHWIYLLRFSRS